MCLRIDPKVKLPESTRNYFYGYKIFKYFYKNKKNKLRAYYRRETYYPGWNIAKGSLNISNNRIHD
jgi:hypothetical protein